jgi:hypothetical protein
LSITYTVPTRGSNIAEEDPSTKQAPRPKVRTPDTFDGKYTKLKKFLLQYNLYLELREKDFDNKTDKVYFAIVLLKDTAADWAEPYIQQRLDKSAAEQLLETQTMFADFCWKDSYNPVIVAGHVDRPEYWLFRPALLKSFGPVCRTVTLVNTSTVTIILRYRIFLLTASTLSSLSKDLRLQYNSLQARVFRDRRCLYKQSIFVIASSSLYSRCSSSF